MPSDTTDQSFPVLLLSVTAWQRNIPPAHPCGTALCSPCKMLLFQAVYFKKVTSPFLSHDGARDLYAHGTPICMTNKITTWTDLYAQVPLTAQHKWHDAYLQLVQVR